MRKYCFKIDLKKCETKILVGILYTVCVCVTCYSWNTIQSFHIASTSSKTTATPAPSGISGHLKNDKSGEIHTICKLISFNAIFEM